TIGVHIFRQVRRADAALFVSGHRVIDKLWVGQVEIVHQFNKVCRAFVIAEPGIALFFLKNGGNVALIVIVARVDQSVVRQAKKFVVDALEESFRAATLKVRPPTAVNQQSIPCENFVGNTIGVMIVGVSGGV